MLLSFMVFIIPSYYPGIINSTTIPKKIGYMNFDNNLVDPLGYLNPHNHENVIFVPGKTGLSVRSSHAGDDGSGSNDFIIQGRNSWPDTNEMYIRFYYKFDHSYVNDSHNVKWLWTLGSDFHQELIVTNLTDKKITLLWQLTGGSAWSNRIVSKYGDGEFTIGEWNLIEIYFKLSTGLKKLNFDGVQWVKINGKSLIYQTDVCTGMPGKISVPGINATRNQPSGCGWWEIDELEIWNGIPNKVAQNMSCAIPGTPTMIKIDM
jgi:hypothetical protein